MTRVLMTADAVGGVWTYVLELADALAPAGVEVHLVVLGPEPSATQRRAAAESACASVVCAPFALEWMSRPWDEVDAAGRWLRQHAADIRPDVVHLNGYALADLDWPAPVLVVAHSDVLSWWRAVHGEPAPPEWDEYRRRVGAGLGAADAVCAPTAAVLADLAREYGVTGGHVVPNGRRPRGADAASPVVKDPLVMAAGRGWDAAKNLELLDRIAPSLPWPVEIAGEGASPRFLGPLAAEELQRRLDRAAIFVAPARYEPFGLAVLEAAGAGCALVLSDLPSLREVWDAAARYVSPGDEQGFTSAVQRLIAEPDLLADYAARAVVRAQRYRPERMAAGYLELYQQLRVRVAS
jgi:glycosyltransferase involved in cell wall biosynthesis